jgi:hypothetical protein
MSHLQGFSLPCASCFASQPATSSGCVACGPAAVARLGDELADQPPGDARREGGASPSATTPTASRSSSGSTSLSRKALAGMRRLEHVLAQLEGGEHGTRTLAKAGAIRRVASSLSTPGRRIRSGRRAARRTGGGRCGARRRRSLTARRRPSPPPSARARPRRCSAPRPTTRGRRVRPRRSRGRACAARGNRRSGGGCRSSL